MLDLLLISVFAAHLWAVGLAMTLPLLCVALEWRESRRGDPAAGALGRRLAWHGMLGLLAGVVLGLVMVALLWALRCDAWFQGLRVVPPRRLWFGLAELGFYLLCMGLYVALWDRCRQCRWLHRGLALLAATNLAYHFPPLFGTISAAATRSDLWGQTLPQAELMRMMFAPETVAKALHFCMASLAIAGLWLAGLASLRPGVLNSRSAAILGGRTALAAALLQMPTGVYLLVSMPAATRDQLLGGDMALSGAFALGLVASLCLMYQLLAVALGDCSRATLLRSLALLIATMLIMVGVQYQSQSGDFPQAPPAQSDQAQHGPAQ